MTAAPGASWRRQPRGRRAPRSASRRCPLSTHRGGRPRAASDEQEREIAAWVAEHGAAEASRRSKAAGYNDGRGVSEPTALRYHHKHGGGATDPAERAAAAAAAPPEEQGTRPTFKSIREVVEYSIQRMGAALQATDDPRVIRALAGELQASMERLDKIDKRREEDGRRWRVVCYLPERA